MKTVTIPKDELLHKVYQSNIPFKDEVFYLISTLQENEIEFRRVNDGYLFTDKFFRGNYLIEFPTDDIIFQDKFCKEYPDFMETGYFAYFEANSGLNAICPGLDQNLNVVFCVIHPYKGKCKDDRSSITDQMNNVGMFEKLGRWMKNKTKSNGQ